MSAYFFYEKIFSVKDANQTKINQKGKNMRRKNNKGNNFSRIKTSKSGKIVYFAFFSI